MNMSADLFGKIKDLEPGLQDAFLSMMDEVDLKTKLIPEEGGDFEQLKGVVKELAEAQKQPQVEVRSLAEAQERTEDSVKILEDVRKQLGWLSMAFGYGVKDRLMPYLDRFALLEFGITGSTADRLTITYPNGRHDEVNIYVEGEKDGRKAYLIGECKSQPGKRDFVKLEEMLDRLRRHLEGEVMGMMVGYSFAPEVTAYAVEHHPGIKRYKTYEVERRASALAA